MKFQILAGIAIPVALLGLARCNGSSVLPHKLVATAGEHTVPLYPDEATYLKVAHTAQEGGVTGMVGDARKELSARKIDDQTRVEIISSDSNGALVQVVQGPMKGTTGFAPRQNLD